MLLLCTIFLFESSERKLLPLQHNTTAELPCSFHSLKVKVWVCLANLIDSLSHLHTHTQQCSMCGKLARIEEREKEQRMQNQAKFTESNKATILFCTNTENPHERLITRADNRVKVNESELTDWLIDQSKKRERKIASEKEQKQKRVTKKGKDNKSARIQRKCSLFSFHFNPSKLSKLLLFRRSFSYIPISLSTRISSWSAAAAKTPAKLPLAWTAHTRAQLFLTLFFGNTDNFYNNNNRHIRHSLIVLHFFLAHVYYHCNCCCNCCCCLSSKLYYYNSAVALFFLGKTSSTKNFERWQNVSLFASLPGIIIIIIIWASAAENIVIRGGRKRGSCCFALLLFSSIEGERMKNATHNSDHFHYSVCNVCLPCHTSEREEGEIAAAAAIAVQIRWHWCCWQSFRFAREQKEMRRENGKKGN